MKMYSPTDNLNREYALYSKISSFTLHSSYCSIDINSTHKKAKGEKIRVN